MEAAAIAAVVTVPIPPQVPRELIVRVELPALEQTLGKAERHEVPSVHSQAFSANGPPPNIR